MLEDQGTCTRSPALEQQSKPLPAPAAPGLCRPRCALVPRVSALGVVGAAALCKSHCPRALREAGLHTGRQGRVLAAVKAQ